MLITPLDWPQAGFVFVAVALLALLVGCAARPSGPPIVLRPQAAGRPVARRVPTPPRPGTVVAATPTMAATPTKDDAKDAAAAELSPAEKEDLFRRFNDRLIQSGAE